MHLAWRKEKEEGREKCGSPLAIKADLQPTGRWHGKWRTMEEEGEKQGSHRGLWRTLLPEKQTG